MVFKSDINEAYSLITLNTKSVTVLTSIYQITSEDRKQRKVGLESILHVLDSFCLVLTAIKWPYVAIAQCL